MNSNILLYTTATDQISVQVQYEDGTFWLTQKRMAELFGVDVRTINEHLGNIYIQGELPKTETIRKIRTVQLEGQRQVARQLTAMEAKLKAEQEYEAFRIVQDKNYVSDFDQELKLVMNNP